MWTAEPRILHRKLGAGPGASRERSSTVLAMAHKWKTRSRDSAAAASLGAGVRRSRNVLMTGAHPFSARAPSVGLAGEEAACGAETLPACAGVVKGPNCLKRSVAEPDAGAAKPM